MRSTNKTIRMESQPNLAEFSAVFCSALNSRWNNTLSTRVHGFICTVCDISCTSSRNSIQHLKAHIWCWTTTQPPAPSIIYCHIMVTIILTDSRETLHFISPSIYTNHVMFIPLFSAHCLVIFIKSCIMSPSVKMLKSLRWVPEVGRRTKSVLFYYVAWLAFCV